MHQVMPKDTTDHTALPPAVNPGPVGYYYTNRPGSTGTQWMPRPATYGMRGYNSLGLLLPQRLDNNVPIPAAEAAITADASSSLYSPFHVSDQKYLDIHANDAPQHGPAWRNG